LRDFAKVENMNVWWDDKENIAFQISRNIAFQILIIFELDIEKTYSSSKYQILY